MHRRMMAVAALSACAAAQWPPAGGPPVTGNFGKIVCPVIGMFVKNGALRPDASGFITMASTQAAFRSRGIPEDMVLATTNGNFKSSSCPKCPSKINPFEMNTLRNGQIAPSPTGKPQEHFRSTGIRDTDNAVPNSGAFNHGERTCIGSDNAWSAAEMQCFANIWDRDTGCGGITSNDVDSAKRPKGCGTCQGFLQNKLCKSQLLGSIEDLFRAFKSPTTGKITASEFRGMWLDLTIPPRMRIVLPPRLPPSPRCLPGRPCEIEK